ncbi:MAG TPA: rhomboid family intramembrane serine protease [Propionibacteriaceae bacterium]|nr:rhomboid family intramembrane serine protease [Propionibacteriaceae bacterium]
MTDRWREFQVRPGRTEERATVGIVAAILGLALAGLVLPVQQWMMVGSSPSFAFQIWRPLAFAFTSAGLINAAITSAVLYFMGRGLETVIGSANYLALFVLSGLGGATAMVVFGPAAALSGSTCGLFGIIAGYAVHKYRHGEDVRPDIILLAFFIIWGITAGANDWTGDIGAIITGAFFGYVFSYSPWRDRERRVTLAAIGIVSVCMVAVFAVWVYA